MKKVIMLIIATSAIAFTSKAQDNKTDFRESINFGAKIGANYSNVWDSQGEEFRADAKVGFAVGAFVSIPIGAYIGVQPEILFSQKGFKATGKLLGTSYSLTRTTNYLDIPILFALKPSEFITVVAGPQYSYLMKQTDVFANGSTSIEQEKVFENDNIRNNTFCLTAGVDLTMKQIVVSGRGGWDVQNNNGDGTSSTPRYKNMWYQATIGYRF